MSQQEKRSRNISRSRKVSRHSHGEISVSSGAEGGAAEAVQAVDQDQRARQVLPPFGDGVPHPVQAHVELLDDVAVAVSNVGGPGEEEVIRWLPHALRTEQSRERSSGEVLLPPQPSWRTSPRLQQDS